MQDNVRDIRDGSSIIAPGNPVPSVVAMLEDVLAEAKAGRVAMVALAAIDWFGHYQVRRGGEGSVLTLIGATATLQADIIEEHRRWNANR